VALACAVAMTIPLLWFIADQIGIEAAGAEIVLAAMLLSTASPAIVLSVYRERPGAGPFGSTMLASSLLLNLVAGGLVLTIGGLGDGVLISSVLGLAVGGGIGFALVRHGGGSAAISALLGYVLLEPLPESVIASMAAAFSAGLIRANVRARGPEHAALSLSIDAGLAAFFGLTGVLTDVRALQPVALVALPIAVGRGIAIFTSSYASGRWLEDDLARRYGFTALLPQGGFPLIIATTVLDPAWQPLLIAVVLINALAMPPLARIAQLSLVIDHTAQGRASSVRAHWHPK
jgi:hypothetical protein